MHLYYTYSNKKVYNFQLLKLARVEMIKKRIIAYQNDYNSFNFNIIFVHISSNVPSLST